MSWYNEMSGDIDLESDDWPPKTINDVIDAFLVCAEKDEMELVSEISKDRIPWLARNLDSLLTSISDLSSRKLLDELGDRNMNNKEAKIKLTEEIWKYWHSQ